MGEISELPAQESRDSKATPLPDHNIEDMGGVAPPPYSVHASDSASPGQAPASIYSASTLPPPPPFTPSQPTKVQESDAISASHSVNITGPLHVLGKVSSSSSVTLTNSITVDGKVNSSSSISLINGIIVGDKVNSSSKIKIDGGELGADIKGKVSASGSVEIFGGEGMVGVDVREKVSASGSILLVGSRGGVRILGKVSASGGIEIRGDVSVGEEVSASGKVKIFCNHHDGGRLKVGGKISGSSVSIEGHLISEYVFFTLRIRLNLANKVQGEFPCQWKLDHSGEFDGYGGLDR